MQLQEMSAQFLIEEGEIKGFYLYQDGQLKLYTIKEASISDLSDIFRPKSV